MMESLVGTVEMQQPAGEGGGQTPQEEGDRKLIGFRREAVVQAFDHRFGSIVLHHSKASSALTVLVVGFLAALAAFASITNYARREKIEGTVVATTGAVTLSAPQAGVLSVVPPRDVMVVSRGDLLFEILGDRQAQGMSADAAISTSLRQRRENLQFDAQRQSEQFIRQEHQLSAKVDDLTDEVKRAQAQIELQSKRVALAQAAVDRQRALVESSFISKLGFQQQLSDLIDQEQREGEFRKAAAAAKRELAAASSELALLRIQAQREKLQLERSIYAIDQELAESEAKRVAVIRSPNAGRMDVASLPVGQLVAAGQHLGTLLPEGAHMEAELYAPSKSVGLLRPGQEVLIQYRAFPYQKFGQPKGRVREIASVGRKAAELGIPLNGSPSETYYVVKIALESEAVTLNGQKYPIKAGMSLDASVQLEKRRLYEWIFSPILELRQRFE